MRSEAQGCATGYTQPPLCSRGSWLVEIVKENRTATSFLAGFLDTLVTGVQRPLALGLFHQLLLRLSFGSLLLLESKVVLVKFLLLLLGRLEGLNLAAYIEELVG
jgi:hypothetical protein